MVLTGKSLWPALDLPLENLLRFPPSSSHSRCSVKGLGSTIPRFPFSFCCQGGMFLFCRSLGVKVSSSLFLPSAERPRLGSGMGGTELLGSSARKSCWFQLKTHFLEQDQPLFWTGGACVCLYWGQRKSLMTCCHRSSNEQWYFRKCRELEVISHRTPCSDSFHVPPAPLCSKRKNYYQLEAPKQKQKRRIWKCLSFSVPLSIIWYIRVNNTIM